MTDEGEDGRQQQLPSFLSHRPYPPDDAPQHTTLHDKTR